MLQRPIPSSGEMLPVIGLGTYRGFDKAPGTPGYDALADVIGALVDAGGTVVDSSPMYGRAETSVGDIIAAQSRRPRCFVATKVWTSGRAAGVRQMEQSLARLAVDQIDLMQVHNLVGYDEHIGTLREWKKSGRVRYVGISHYTLSAYAEVEAVLRREPLDFLQINYSVEDRSAGRRLLPLAQERGVAVVVNLPFGGGGLLRGLAARALPPWAAEIACTTWAQVLLKFVLSHPAVTCVIPGTGDAEHMARNALAGDGLVPDVGYWRDRLDKLAPQVHDARA
jgi:diketogulonate reductase-like aldo/keto reductase